MGLTLTAAAFVYAGFLVKSLGYLARDELWLRCLLLLGTVFNILYYTHYADEPMWDPIITNTLLALVNIGVIVVVVIERSTIGMRRADAQLFSKFQFLTPGQFRVLLRRGHRRTTQAPEVILNEGAPVERLFYLVDGTAEAEKGSARFEMHTGAFMGEIGFLTDRPASATVRLRPGTEYVVWEVAELRRLFRRSPALRNGLMAHLNRDLSGKVTASVPMQPPSTRAEVR